MTRRQALAEARRRWPAQRHHGRLRPGAWVHDLGPAFSRAAHAQTKQREGLRLFVEFLSCLAGPEWLSPRGVRGAARAHRGAIEAFSLGIVHGGRYSAGPLDYTAFDFFGQPVRSVAAQGDTWEEVFRRADIAPDGQTLAVGPDTRTPVPPCYPEPERKKSMNRDPSAEVYKFRTHQHFARFLGALTRGLRVLSMPWPDKGAPACFEPLFVVQLQTATECLRFACLSATHYERARISEARP